jgi:Ca2+-transporting ATPase
MSEPYSLDLSQILSELKTTASGLTSSEAVQRLQTDGPNVFPSKKPPSLLKIFVSQFFNPLIYILLIASAIAFFLGDTMDAFFIFIVLLANAAFGTIQEYGAEQSAQALHQMTSALCTIERGGKILRIPTEQLVRGDLVLLESGDKVPADLRLFHTHLLEIDESLLTGESLPVQKDHSRILPDTTTLSDRTNMAFTGTLVTQGRARGLVTATGIQTELGKIADSILFGPTGRPPLLIRMAAFTRNIAIVLVLLSVAIAIYLLSRGHPWPEVLIFSIALAVSAIPEGLPVALTVALALASRRMAKKNVIVRKLPAVEALGSCTFIATDKTGTLTVNQLTIRKIGLPGNNLFSVSGSGLFPKGQIERLSENSLDDPADSLKDLITAGILCNESRLIEDQGQWIGHGDAVDLAFLVLASKVGIQSDRVREHMSLVDHIPFEPENQFAATLHQSDGSYLISVKGAIEKILPMCSRVKTLSGEAPLDQLMILNQSDQLAESGFRVLALAGAARNLNEAASLDTQLKSLTFFGLVGMIDPLRPEAAEAIAQCKQAGIEVAMVTGDHPKTSLSIARDLGLAHDLSQVVTGPQLKNSRNEVEFDQLVTSARVFARVEPQQKLQIVQSLMKSGRFVAVTGDGANDAPALKAAHVGVAMGKSGTDVAKESASLIITDDRFASIVAGIQEGRIAYSNVRKVIYLLISTGAAEIVIFVLSLALDTPMPLTAVQILWLNLVTNGIQDMALASEPGEGDELKRSARKPNEPIFDRLMIERVLLSATVMGVVSFMYFDSLVKSGTGVEQARNLTLLLMVLFENVMIGNCRSETKSAFLLSPLRNKFLLIGTLAAQGLHIAAMSIPGLQQVLGLNTVSLAEWVRLLMMALSILIVMEIYKFIRDPKAWRGHQSETAFSN